VSILITGATGHLGPHLIAELLRSGDSDRLYVVARRSRMQSAAERIAAIERVARAQLNIRGIAVQRVSVVPLDSERLASADAIESFRNEISVIVHAAADTRFGAPADELRPSNVNGTLALCRIAAECPHLCQFLLVSTACVAGCRSGVIPEAILDDSAGFANAYEQTKWEAEQAALASGLPLRIARLTTCVGSHETGYVHRAGALHHLLHWTARGLVPMIPASVDSGLDLISTDVAGAWLARACTRPPDGIDICHVALGSDRIPLETLLDAVIPLLTLDARAPSIRPMLVEPSVFQSFSDMVRVSGDALFVRVQQSAASVLPTLLHPKTYDTSNAERCWGSRLPHPDWRHLLTRVVASEIDRRTAARAHV
jgi:nucleoside-diphosphate-sugar epimerase